MAKRRAASPRELINTNFENMNFTGEWKELFGKPQMGGCWLIWGDSSNGKTTFTLRLARYLCRFTRVVYNSIEEGISKSLQEAIIRENLIDVQGSFFILHKETMPELIARLEKRKSPGVIIIDSVQYADLNRRTAKELIDRYPHKLFIFVSHAAGKMPDGRTANALRYHADVKIRIEGFRAFINSRYGGDTNTYYTIYKKGASNYWGETSDEEDDFIDENTMNYEQENQEHEHAQEVLLATEQDAACRQGADSVAVQ